MKENKISSNLKLTAVLIVMVFDRISAFDCFPILMTVFQFNRPVELRKRTNKTILKGKIHIGIWNRVMD